MCDTQGNYNKNFEKAVQPFGSCFEPGCFLYLHTQTSKHNLMETAEQHHHFVAQWDFYMFAGAAAFAILAVALFLFYEFRLFLIKDPKEKYDFVNLNEIRYFWYAVLLLIVAAGFLGNTVFTERATAHGLLWFYVRLFITVSFGIIFYFIFSNVVHIYYPRSVERRLQKIRNKPRISPAGNVMRKLSDEEEKTHLEEVGANEVHSVEYDVWVDEQTGFRKIEKYSSYQHAEECPECGYVTLRIATEEVEQRPTVTDEGLLVKHYKCTYCGHRERREVVLSRITENV
jgi:DNA-directed RNA polymerase subunit RPC12/RpoP